MSAVVERREQFCEQTTELTHGSITQEDWAALRRTLFDVHEAFCSLPRPGLIVEVGTLGGRTTRGIFEVLNRLRWDVPDVVTIDTDKRCLGDAVFNQCHGFKNSLRTFHGRSTDWKPVEPIWWAFVDGCHCHECVLADLMHLSRHVPVDGVICLHDAGDQRSLEMLVHERYHGCDGVSRLYGVTSAIDEWLGCFDDFTWEQLECVKAQERPRGSPTPLFGGVQAFRRKRP